MAWGIPAAIAGASVVGGLLANDASKSATRASSRANDQIRDDLTPYRDIGQWGIGEYQNALTNYDRQPFEFNLENDPIYQFSRDEGLNAATRRMNASGYGNSGNILAELQNRGNLFAAQYQDKAHGRQLGEYNMNYLQDQDLLDRYYNLGGMGQNAAAQTGVAGMADARNQGVADYYKAGSVNNALQNSVGNYLDYSAMQPYQGATASSLTPAGNSNSLLFSNGYPSLGGYGG